MSPKLDFDTRSERTALLRMNIGRTAITQGVAPGGVHPPFWACNLASLQIPLESSLRETTREILAEGVDDLIDRHSPVAVAVGRRAGAERILPEDDLGHAD